MPPRQPMRVSGNQITTVKTVLRLIAIVLATTALAQAQSIQPDPPAQPGGIAVPQSYHSITGMERLKWFAKSTAGPETLAAGLFTAGFGTARNAPKEYGPHWDGFGKRYGMRLTGTSTGNAMEAGLGALWGEDPRYIRATGEPIKSRLRNVVISTFTAHNRNGDRMPAYARYVATPGNNFLSNTWRADSEADARSAALRTMWGFVGLMGKNAFSEFWPDIQQHIFHHNR